MVLWKYAFLITSGKCDVSHARRWKSTVKKIEKLLIANRGEIACRVMRTAQRLGVRTVAVYSEADKNALHVAMADEAYKIGPAPATQSYLKGDTILEVARTAKCQAIHPGYGFLSENVEFAESCQKNGVIFIGPPASAIRDMGIKSTSKEIMSKAGVPVIEGYHGENQDVQTLLQEAKRIGFPVMIKAVRGGGGKGMRIANSEAEFAEALESAKSESQKSFGDSVVLLEKFVSEPRHVEVQVFADTHGNAVHLFERDCSVQRRHQKIIEEAPAPLLSEKARNELGAAAVRAAKAVGYVGAGTVEFILDKKSHSFHFMEMNTRLQVEHPVTEMITGTDLVEWQIKVASGEELPLSQKDITRNGHAFEARIYAENPRGGFLPGAGPLLHLVTPEPAADVRIETGVSEGDEVSVHYDPMIAKLVVWGKDRIEALSKLRRQLSQYNIAGLETNVNFLLDLAKHEEFVLGNVHTNFIRDHNNSLFPEVVPSDSQIVQAALFTILNEKHYEREQAARKNDISNPFVIESGFRINYQHLRVVNFKFGDRDYVAKIRYTANGSFEISTGGNKWWEVRGELIKNGSRNTLKSNIDGKMDSVFVYGNDSVVALYGEDGKMEFEVAHPKFLDDDIDDGSSGSNRAVTPMPGVLDKVLVSSGDGVKKGDTLFVLVAMKMEYVVKAERDAKIAKVHSKPGDSVPKGQVIVEFEE